jgi:hypothetical protein
MAQIRGFMRAANRRLVLESVRHIRDTGNAIASAMSADAADKVDRMCRKMEDGNG